MNYIIKTILNYPAILFLIFLLSFASCLETVEIDLKSTAPVFVIEGVVELGATGWVKLSYTTDYFSTEVPEYIESATVSIMDDMDHFEILESEGDGIYRGLSLRGRVDRKYTLNISVNDFAFTASSNMISPALIYSLDFEEFNLGIPGNKINLYNAKLRFKDDPFNENYYMVKYWRNDTLDNDSYTIFRDSYYLNQDTVVFSSLRNQFHIGDTVRASLYSIDRDAYIYYNQLNDLLESGIGGFSTPYNPQSNLGTGTMGYFVAYSYSTITSIVRK